MADSEVRIRFEGDARDAVDAARDTSRAIDGLDKSARRTGPSLKALGGVALAGFAALGAAARVGWQEFSEGERVAAQTEAALKSTGGVANVTAREIGDLATTLMNLSGVDDELIQKGENLLLTFKNVRNEVGQGNDIFARATRSALDLSVAGFGSMESTSIALGKALNDPIAGMTALGRRGITFSEDQKKAITAMVESNNVLGAQKLILKEVESQVGGSAKALGETLPGQINIAKETLNNFAGDVVARVVPALAAGIGWLRDHWPEIQRVIREWWAEAKPTLEAFRDLFVAIWPIAKAAIEAFIPILQGLAEAFRGVVQVIAGILSGDWTMVWNGIKSIATGTIGAIIAWWRAALSLWRAIITAALDAIRSLFEDAFQAVASFVRARVDEIVGFFRALPARLLATVASLVGVALGPFKEAFTAAKQWVGEQVSGIVGFFVALPARIAGTLGALASAAIEPLRKLFGRVGDAIDGIRAGIDWIRENAIKVFRAVADALQGPLGALGGYLSPVSGLLNSIISAVDGIIARAGDVAAAIGKIKSVAGGIVGKIPGFATGVTNFGGGLAVVGERGPELVRLPRGADVIPNAALSLAGGGRTGGPQVLNVTVRADGFMVGSRQDLADSITRMIVPYLPDGHRVAAYRSPV